MTKIHCIYDECKNNKDGICQLKDLKLEPVGDYSIVSHIDSLATEITSQNPKFDEIYDCIDVWDEGKATCQLILLLCKSFKDKPTHPAIRKEWKGTPEKITP